MKIGVIGAGSWGTALASLLAEDSQNQVLLWAFEEEVALNINQNHKNPLYMSHVELPKALLASNHLEDVVQNASLLLNVVPSHHTRAVWKKIKPYIGKKTIIVNCSKGFEEESKKRLSEVLMEVLESHPKSLFNVLSGPSFAEEVLKHQPTTVVIAGFDRKVMTSVQRLFRREWFLTYLNDDIVGVEVGGALKNVIAIASGICDGIGLGFNTRAALITRGIYEIAKLGKALGAKPFTFAGLSGIGDLILTCTGPLSRNRELGVRLGKGEKLPDILKKGRFVAEGVKTAKVAYELIGDLGVNAPLFVEIYHILFEEKSPKAALKDLLSLELKEELGGLFARAGEARRSLK